MTPEEWDASADPRAMIAAAGDRVSARKWRLFMAAAVRDARRFHLLPAVTDACTLAERFADGLVDRKTFTTAYANVYAGWSQSELPMLLTPGTRGLAGSAGYLCHDLDRIEPDPPRRAGWLREVVGNPFRWLQWEDGWVTPTAHTLAADAYARGRFDALPVLADALDDAGCEADAVTAHLRGPGPHARGCWAMDLVLGKC